jgi:hypothetical protein
MGIPLDPFQIASEDLEFLTFDCESISCLATADIETRDAQQAMMGNIDRILREARHISTTVFSCRDALIGLGSEIIKINGESYACAHGAALEQVLLFCAGVVNVVDSLAANVVLGRSGPQFQSERIREKWEAVKEWVASRPEIDWSNIRARLSQERVGMKQQAPADPPGERVKGEDAKVKLLSVYTKGISDERIEQAARALDSTDLNAEEKLDAIHKAMPIPVDVPAEKLGAMLGVSKQAVCQGNWWKEHRRGKSDENTERRKTVHRQRAKHLD